MAYRLYLPKDWAEDPAVAPRRGCPRRSRFKTKPEIALDQIRAACEVGLPGDVVVMDAGYGNDAQAAHGHHERGEALLCAGIQPQTLVWAPGTRRAGRRRSGGATAAHAISAKDVALGLRAKRVAHDRVARRHERRLSSRFARVACSRRIAP